MKTFSQFLSEIKTISYPAAKAHNVYLKGRVTKVKSGKAVPVSTTSGAGNGGGNGD